MENTPLKRGRAGDWEEDLLQSMKVERVGHLVEKGAVAVELLDDILQPETLALLHRLPEVSDSLSRILDGLKRLEESGALKNLAEMIELLAQLKSTWTGPMVVEAIEKARKAVESADDLRQKDFPELADGILMAVESACKERREADGPLSLFQLLRALSDPEVREGLSFLLFFIKALPKTSMRESS